MRVQNHFNHIMVHFQISFSTTMVEYLFLRTYKYQLLKCFYGPFT